MNANQLQAEIQRLVDGELPHDRRVRLLENLARRPNQWRDLAIAFVERQVLDESLLSKVAPRLPSLEVNGVSQSDHAQNIHRLASKPPSKGTHGSRVHRLGRAVTAAACLLIGFAVGNWRVPLPHPPDGPGVASTAKETLDESADSSQGSDKPISVIPLADALSRASYPIPVDLRREMMRQGYLITELDRLSKVQLPTGQTVELPVRQVAVTYLGNAAYQ
jgi:hypothetical protein